MEKVNPKIGDYIGLTWKKADNSLWGGTEGFVLGIIQDNNLTPYLIVDRSTYDNSLKSIFFSLGLLDLWIVPTSELESVLSLSPRERPPGIIETTRFKMEIDYKSNVDYEETRAKLHKSGFFVDLNQPVQTNGSCNFTIGNIESIEGATIIFSPRGNVQIHCLPKQLNECLMWLEKSVEIQPGHKHLVLIPTNFMLHINDLFKETAEPTENIIDKLGQTEGNKTTIFPLGWVHHFFAELDNNPLRELFPDSELIEDRILITNKKKAKVKRKKHYQGVSNKTNPLNLSSLNNQVTISKYLSAEPPIMKFTGLILKPEEEDAMKDVWFRSRFDRWQWFESGSFGSFHGKALIRNLVIDRKNGVHTWDFRKYYGTDF